MGKPKLLNVEIVLLDEPETLHRLPVVRADQVTARKNAEDPEDPNKVDWAAALDWGMYLTAKRAKLPHTESFDGFLEYVVPIESIDEDDPVITREQFELLAEAGHIKTSDSFDALVDWAPEGEVETATPTS